MMLINRVVVLLPCAARQRDLEVSGRPPFSEIARQISAGSNDAQFRKFLDRIIDLLELRENRLMRFCCELQSW
jgi:hypothetical protein